MSTSLSETGLTLYELLTSRTFFVVDTEFSTDEDGEHHLISIAVIPVVGGHRVKPRDELYLVMNPSVPIDLVTSTIHGFRDDDVANKPMFSHFAKVIAERLGDTDGVFVSHTTIDAHVLAAEFGRLPELVDDPSTAYPDLPVLDTQRLARVTDYPGAPKSGYVSLERLCELTGVAKPDAAHNARDDARSTADALIELLRHAAEHRVFWSLDALLDAANGGTTREPRGPAHIRARSRRHGAPPPEHLMRHALPLTSPVQPASPEAEAWLDLAAECAQLRCPYARDEARAAAAANGAALLRPLMEDLAHLVEPGQPGTLVGAALELLAGSDLTSPALPVRSALRWWTGVRDRIAKSPPCDTTSSETSCPSCREGQPCPRDVLVVAVAELVTLGERGVLDHERIRDLLRPSARGPLNAWRHHPDVLAYALWRVAAHHFEGGHDEAAFTVVDQGIAQQLHLADPRLALLAVERLTELGDLDGAFAAASDVLAARNSDPAYDDLADWLLFTQSSLQEQVSTTRAALTHPRRARPPGHVNERLYS